MRTISSTGFVLPNGARRSADAAWSLKSRVDDLEAASGQRYWRLCADFVIELHWLIDPERKSLTIYRADGTIETRTNLDSIRGEAPVADFSLELAFIWNPLAGQA